MENANAPESGQDEMMSAMFANMIIQHTNMAVVFLGLAPNPQTGETKPELEHAQYFIDQLEMLQIKTKGNLTKQEEGLLKQSLSSLHMAFVEVVNKVGTPPASPAVEPAKTEEPAPPSTAAAPESTPATDESKKKFTKKY